MTVKELIERLQQEDPSMPVHFSHPSGDYWRTQLAPCVTSVDIGYVKHDDYHNKPVIADDCDDSAIEVVVLNYVVK